MNRRHMLIGTGSLLALGGAAAWVARRRSDAAAAYSEAMRALRADLPAQPQVQDLIRHATLAASGHNTQPWIFSVAPGRITLQPDFTRRTPVVDPDDHHLYASLGCATENLALAAAARGQGGELAFDDNGDGLYSAASGNPALPDWLAPHAFDMVFRAKSENAKYAEQLRSSAGVAVFIGQKDDREHWVRAGRACQRFALQATALGLKCAFVNQPVEVAALRPALAALVGLPGRRPNIVLRFGHGPTLPYAPRRPVETVIRTA